MNQRTTISAFRTALRSVDFDSRLIVDSYSFTDFDKQRAVIQTIPLAAFSTYPSSYRNACVGVIFSSDVEHGADWVYGHRALGAPLIFEIGEKNIQPWTIGPSEARRIGRPFDFDSIESTFHSHRAIWNPDVLGRLKLASDAKPNPQRDFYDTGLLPVLEQFFQTKLKDLLERAFADTADCYRSVHGKEPAVGFLFPYLFRFVTAKIFMDRADAQGWDGLGTPKQILEKAEKHSGSKLLERLPSEFFERRVLAKVWESISGTLHFQNLSVPDLVGIYEDLFIDDSARRKLGIHSTPLGLASYIVNHLPWEQIPISERIVVEGFSGHGIFLAQAMERMRVDLDPKLTPRQRHQYFQKRLIGVEKDPLAIEVCRLLLTLSDYPNDNSWQLYPNDIFDWPQWDTALTSASVVLANPPYEPFPFHARKQVNATKAQPPAEFIHRLMRKPPPMLGLVLPQSFLTSPFYQEANRQLARHYTDVSIVELPKLFKYADNETVAVMASERRDTDKHVTVSYAEVPPDRTSEFLGDFTVSAKRVERVDVTRIGNDFTLWVPPRGSLFERLDGFPKLNSVATLHQGVHWTGRTDGKPRTKPRFDVVKDSGQEGFEKGVDKMAGNFSQFQVLQFRYLSLLEKHQWPRDKAWKLPWKARKVVCNSARFERKSPWRLGAWADAEGLVFSKAFFGIWPNDGVSEFALAAILSSPVASAFSFERDLDRSNRITTLAKLPIPAFDHLKPGGNLHNQVEKLQQLLRPNLFRSDVNTATITEALIRLDADVLEAYELPDRVQRQLLNQFQNWKRPVAVPFTGYFPVHFKDAITLSDFVAIQYEWDAKTNERRCDLIEKELSVAGLTKDERLALEHLQHLADLLVRLKAPYPLEELGGIVAELKAKGKWKPSI